mgnify:CR=1 FL=1
MGAAAAAAVLRAEARRQRGVGAAGAVALAGLAGRRGLRVEVGLNSKALEETFDHVFERVPLAGGVIGAGYYAKQSGHDSVFTLDMGGTSFDVSLVVDGKPDVAMSSFSTGNVLIFRNTGT